MNNSIRQREYLEAKRIHESYNRSIMPLINAKTNIIQKSLPILIINNDGTISQKYDEGTQAKLMHIDLEIKAITELYKKYFYAHLA